MLKKYLTLFLLIFQMLSCSKDYYNQKLIEAILKDDIESVRSLKGKADYNILDENKNPLINLALSNETINKGLIEALLDAGADPNKCDQKGNNALHLALMRESTVDIAKLILEKSEELEINAVNKEGSTALHLATNIGAKGLIEALLDAGADPNKCDQKGNNALHLALMRESTVDIAKLIWEKSEKLEMNAVNNEGLTALHLATQIGAYEIISDLIKKGADVKIKDKKGKSILEYIPYRGYVNTFETDMTKTRKVIELFINNGITLNDINKVIDNIRKYIDYLENLELKMLKEDPLSPPGISWEISMCKEVIKIYKEVGSIEQENQY